MRSFVTRLGLAALLTCGPVAVAGAGPADAASWCVPDSAQEAYEAILVAAPDGSAFETEARGIAEEAEAAGRFDTPETLTRLDDAAYEHGYLYDCDTDAYTFAPAETGYQTPTSSTTSTTRPAPTTTTTRPAPAPTTTTTVRSTPTTATTTTAGGAPPASPAAPPPPPGPSGGASTPAPVTSPPAPARETGPVTPFSDESPLSVFPSGGIRPEGGGPEVTSTDGGQSATGAPLGYRREAVERSLLPAPVRMAMKAIAVTLALCLAGLAVAVILNRRRITPDAPPAA